MRRTGTEGVICKRRGKRVQRVKIKEIALGDDTVVTSQAAIQVVKRGEGGVGIQTLGSMGG